MNMPLALLNRRRRGAVAFSPTALFALAEPGVWYDPSDLTTLFQDTAGTTPVTTPGQSVALALDKSKGLVLGPELVVNGDFSSATGWTLATGWSIGSGVASHNGTGAGSQIDQPSILVSGRTYIFSFDLVVTSGGGVAVRPTKSSGTGQITFTTSGSYRFVFVSGDGGVTFAALSSFVGSIDNISVKELPGFHATQATTASRPIYGINPVGGRRNLLTFTEQFDNAAWTKIQSSISANAAAAPSGATVADKLVEGSGTVTPLVRFSSTLSAVPHAFSVYAKASERSWFRLINTTTGRNVYFNVSTGAVGTASSGMTGSIESVGSGWYRCSVFETAASGANAHDIRLALADGGGSYTGDGTSGILIWGAQLETGSTATAYQRVVSQYDVTEAGVSSLSYLQFDTSKFLVTPTITPGIDKAQVFAGVRKLSDAAIGIVAEHGTDSFTNSGGFYLAAPLGTGASGNYAFWSRGGTGGGSPATAPKTAPTTDVVTGLADISGDSRIIRRNGTQVSQDTGDQGTGNFLAYPLYIGMRAGSSLPFNGQIFSLIVRFGANLTADQITSTETWVNGKTRAY